MIRLRLQYLLVVIVLVLPLSAHAATPYFEFLPDYREPFLISTASSVEQVFLPLNDHTSGFDFWMSNSAEGTSATFTLFSPAGTVLSTQTQSLPALADTDSGTRVHINLDTQIAITGNQAYRIRVSSPSIKLRLYWTLSNEIIVYNGPAPSQHTNGTARIDGIDRGQSFVYALYETTESTQPILSGIEVNNISPTQSIIFFSASEPVDRKIALATSIVDWLGQYTSCAPTVVRCSVTLSVSPATTYSYTLSVRDVWGNLTSAIGTFTSLGEDSTPTPTATPTTSPSPTATPPTPSATPDSSGPSITNARLVSSTATSATFAWTTDEAANSTVIVQLLPYFINAGSGNDSAFDLEHYVVVSNLTPDTEMRAAITSSDTSGNISQTFINFLTPQATPPQATPPNATNTPAPTPSAQPPTLSTTADGQQQLTWFAPTGGDAPSQGYRIDIFDSSNNLIRTITVPLGQYEAILGTLPKGSRVVIYANNDGVFQKIATPISTQEKKGGSSLLIYILSTVVLIALLAGRYFVRKKPTPPGAMPGPPMPPPSLGVSR